MLAHFRLVYALLIAIPFVPRIEVGLTLMAMEGSWISRWIHVATAVGLAALYAAGEGSSYARPHRIPADLHLRRACRVLERLQPLGKADRLALLQSRAALRTVLRVALSLWADGSRAGFSRRLAIGA